MGNLVVIAAVAAAMFLAGAVADRVYRQFGRPDREGRPAIYTVRASQFRALHAPADVVMVGDSLTNFGEWGELLGPQVLNRGIGRDTTKGLLERIDTIPPAKATFLLIGTNDLESDSAGAIAARTRRIAAALPGDVYVQSVLSRGDRFDDKVGELNALNAAWCGQGHCTYVELNDVVTSRIADGVHLDGAAYLAWADHIRPIVARYTEIAPASRS